MAASKSMAWLVVIGAVTLALVGLSFVALDKDNVVWRDGKPFCPHCRTGVPAYAHRCPTCREEFDWAIPADDDSPVCTYCMSLGEDDLLRDKKKALGDGEAAKRLAAALPVTDAAATEYLRSAGRGQCSWCGGSGRDLARVDVPEAVCPVCFGAKRCVFCGGDRRVRVGVEASGRDLSRYRAFVAGIEGDLAPAAAAQKDLAGWNEGFLKNHAGDEEAAELLLPQTVRIQNNKPKRAGDVSRQRVSSALEALAR